MLILKRKIIMMLTVQVYYTDCCFLTLLSNVRRVALCS